MWRTWPAHRLSWALHVDPASGRGVRRQLRHTCAVRCCVNPDHLRLVVHAAATDGRSYALAHFEERYTPDPNSGCWLWTGATGAKGYGSAQLSKHAGRWGGPWVAHRLSYALFVACLPTGRQHHVCHRCDVPSCVNPAHLFLGSAKDNEQDKIAKGRRAPFTWKDRIARGSRAGPAKLRESDIPVIRARRAAGETQAAIAHDFGVTQAVISCIDRGFTWKHVPRLRPRDFR